jgi:hypothetical protein
MYYKNKLYFKLLLKNINTLYTIDEFVIFLQCMTNDITNSDDLAEQILSHIKYNKLNEDTMVRISNLHKEFGKDFGIYGFTINIVWGCIVFNDTTDTADT